MRADVVVCGAGIAGVATAYYLGVRHGVWNTLLVDPHAPLSQTTAKSGENYRNWWPLSEMAAFTERSVTLMEDIAGACANTIQMQPRGYLYVSGCDDVATQVGQICARYTSAGPLRVHDTAGNSYDPMPDAAHGAQLEGADIIAHGSTIRTHFPHLADRITLAVHARRAGVLSVQQLGMFMLDTLKGHGTQVIRGRVIAVAQNGNGVTGVTLDVDGDVTSIATPTLVNAAGPSFPHVAALAGVDLPVQSVRQQKIAVQDIQGVVPRATPFTIFMDAQHVAWRAQHVAWRDDERTELGADPKLHWLLDQLPGGLHVRPEGSGDSTWIKLGWALNYTPSAPVDDPGVSNEFPELVMRGAAAMIPGLDVYRERLPGPVVHYSGYYTKTSENLPIVGPLGVHGLFGVGALSGCGTMSACAAGELCAAWIADGPRPAYAELMSTARYSMRHCDSTTATLAESGEL